MGVMPQIPNGCFDTFTTQVGLLAHWPAPPPMQQNDGWAILHGAAVALQYSWGL